MLKSTENNFPVCKKDADPADSLKFNDKYSLIKKPLDISTGYEYEKCGYAFFPGCRLAIYEPEIIIKAYDSLLFQHPDTAVFLYCCGLPLMDNTDLCQHDNPLKIIEDNWISMGRPVMITACPSCSSILKNHFENMEVLSLYNFLREAEISGGCNSEDYRIFDCCASQDFFKAAEDTKALAMEMGVRLHDNDGYEYPYITYCIDCRNKLKYEGHEAVHILELIYGMGESNTHMIHSHDHDGNDSNGTQDKKKHAPVPFKPLSAQKREENMAELKQFLLDLFWNK